MQGLNWNDLRCLLALARTASLAAAAKQLGMDATTVGRRLRAAEASLSAQVFHRLPNGRLHPTAVGEQVLHHAEAAEAAVTELTAVAVGADASLAGCVRVTAVPAITGRVLVPAAAAFTRRHPALRLELVGETRNLDLTRREADIALRLGRPEPEAGRLLLTRKLGLLAYAAYAPACHRPEEDAELPWVGYEGMRASQPQARWLALAARSDGGAAVAVNDAEAIIQAVRSGLGRSILPSAIGDRDAGLRRTPVRADLPALPSREVWLLTHPELRTLARIGAVSDWLAATIADVGKPTG